MSLFVRAAALTEVPEGRLHGIILDGDHPVCLARVGGAIYAFEDRCTHAEFPLSAGDLVDGQVIECALHGARFDVKSGEVLESPATDSLTTYEVRVEAGEIWVRVSRDRSGSSEPGP